MYFYKSIFCEYARARLSRTRNIRKKYRMLSKVGERQNILIKTAFAVSLIGNMFIIPDK